MGTSGSDTNTDYLRFVTEEVCRNQRLVFRVEQSYRTPLSATLSCLSLRYTRRSISLARNFLKRCAHRCKICALVRRFGCGGIGSVTSTALAARQILLPPDTASRHGESPGTRFRYKSTVGANGSESKMVSMANCAICWPFLRSTLGGLFFFRAGVFRSLSRADRQAHAKAIELHTRLTAFGLTVLNLLSLTSSRFLFSSERCSISALVE